MRIRLGCIFSLALCLVGVLSSTGCYTTELNERDLYLIRIEEGRLASCKFVSKWNPLALQICGQESAFRCKLRGMADGCGVDWTHSRD